jgi:hypothetical protein
VLTGWTAPLLAVLGLIAVGWGLVLLVRSTGRRARRGAVAVLAVGAAGLLLGGAAFGSAGAPLAVDDGADVSTASRTTAAPSSALAALDRLVVKGPSPMTGYHRVADFGEPWVDVDDNGCDTRDDILRRDLTQRSSTGCEVRSGVLHDPYTGTTIHFVRGLQTSDAVQIDHVVPLADAWRTGAQKLTEGTRTALANDPVNLFAVDGPTNTIKSDGDAATWLPPVKSFRCTYIAHQIAVKRTYSLWVTPAEKAAMTRVLAACPAQRLPTATTPSAATTHSAAAVQVVHPGALCSPLGATGRTSAGTAMTCSTTATDTRARWRRTA